MKKEEPKVLRLTSHKRALVTADSELHMVLLLLCLSVSTPPDFCDPQEKQLTFNMHFRASSEINLGDSKVKRHTAAPWCRKAEALLSRTLGPAETEPIKVNWFHLAQQCDVWQQDRYQMKTIIAYIHV